MEKCISQGEVGGFPWWLNNKENILFRAYNAVYLHYVDLYFNQIIPIIQKRQISQGGAVIMVQVENGYGHLGSDEESSPYLNYLREGIIHRGIDVPLISCAGGVDKENQDNCPLIIY